MEIKSSQRTFTYALLVAVILCYVATVSHLHSSLLTSNTDLGDYNLPWYRHILAYGRWHSLEGSYANYSPPFLYLLSLASFFDGKVPTVMLIKMPAVFFALFAGGMAWFLLRRLGCNRLNAALGALLIPCLPEVALNSYRWGQCDIIHTSLLILFFLLYFRGNKAFACAVLGAAVAVKLQVIFVAPVILGLLLTGEISWTAFAAAPLGFAILMAPAFLAGRPLKQLLLVYSGQYNYYNQITMNAPNPYYFVLRANLGHYGLFVKLGLLAGAIFGVWLTTYYVRHLRGKGADALLTVSALSLLAFPYLLPKMHERYFFSGNCLLAIIAIKRPSLAIPCIMMQVATFITYREYLFLYGSGRQNDLAFLFVTLSLVMIFLDLQKQRKQTSLSNLTRDASPA
jgi:Gpi18-like mannosyltransferase